MSKYRLYASAVRGVVHEDEFEECDNSQPYYDDYYEFELSDTDNFAQIYSEIELLDCSQESIVTIVYHFRGVFDV